jgi:hypothetical protein
MIDLTNKTTEEVNALIQKYVDVLRFIKPQKEIPYLAVVLDVGIAHVKENFKDLQLDWKAWSIVYLKNKYLDGKLKKEQDIPALINGFVNHYKDNYQEFINNLGMFSSDFDRDYGFVCQYLNKKG